MRLSWACVGLLLVSACAPPPDVTGASGVGFGDYDSYSRERAERDAALARSITPGTISDERTGTVLTPLPEAQPTPLRPVSTATAPAADPEGQQTAAATPAAENQQPDNPEISDEQNFEAVSERETIESDAERLERNRNRYVVIEPKALPRRPGSDRPNVVAFALATNNPVGQPLYSRGPFKNAQTTARNCARFQSADLAQEEFLSLGGPKRDPKRLDPDGDGFACTWDPTPFRKIRG